MAGLGLELIGLVDNDAVTIPSLPLDMISQVHERSRNELAKHVYDMCGVEHYVMSRVFISG